MEGGTDDRSRHSAEEKWRQINQEFPLRTTLFLPGNVVDTDKYAVLTWRLETEQALAHKSTYDTKAKIKAELEARKPHKDFQYVFLPNPSRASDTTGEKKSCLTPNSHMVRVWNIFSFRNGYGLEKNGHGP